MILITTVTNADLASTAAQIVYSMCFHNFLIPGWLYCKLSYVADSTLFLLCTFQTCRKVQSKISLSQVVC